ncbi:hypothetical protein [Marinimicrobium sp. C2-29]|uniref:hypothetical protein n=1 Tax=Marinimicrobium sp. C2-29 TaxID=3139825 RepID=UPI003138B19F
MVNNPINISAYSEPAPDHLQEYGADRGIAGGPLYDPARVLELLQDDGRSIQPWTRKCVKDMRDKLCLDHEGVAELVREAVTRGRYLNSQWCRGNKDHIWAACDAYVLCRGEYMVYAHKFMEIEYYLKFAINKSGKFLLLVSSHNPEDR